MRFSHGRQFCIKHLDVENEAPRIAQENFTRQREHITNTTTKDSYKNISPFKSTNRLNNSTVDLNRNRDSTNNLHDNLHQSTISGVTGDILLHLERQKRAKVRMSLNLKPGFNNKEKI